MVEVAGVEPASKDSLQSKSTCLVVLCSYIELQGNQKSFDASRWVSEEVIYITSTYPFSMTPYPSPTGKVQEGVAGLKQLVRNFRLHLNLIPSCLTSQIRFSTCITKLTYPCRNRGTPINWGHNCKNKITYIHIILVYV